MTENITYPHTRVVITRQDYSSTLHNVFNLLVHDLMGGNLMTISSFQAIPLLQNRCFEHLLGPIYSQGQRCDVDSDIALIKLLRFLNKQRKSVQKIGCSPNGSDMMQAVMRTLHIHHQRLIA